MGRIRTIKPNFWRHEGLSALPEATHLLAAALLNYADDEGYFNANERLILADCFPFREPSVTVPESLNLLVGIGYLRLGRGGDGRNYGHVVHFLDHQKVSHPTKSTIKDLPIIWSGSPSPPRGLSEDSRKPHGGLSEASALKGIEGKGKEGEGKGTVASANAAATGAQPQPQPRGGDEDDPESWTDDRLWDEVLAAVGIRGAQIPTYWQPPHGVRHVGRWRHQLGIPCRMIVTEARSSRANHDEPPSGPKALDGVMKRLAAELKAEPLQPEARKPNGSRPGQGQPETPEQRRARWARMAGRVCEPVTKAGGVT